MAPTFNPKDGLLARVNFPLYSLQILTSRHVLVAGGGGASKTGVANGFEIFEVSHDGRQFVAEEVTRHETGLSAVMNCAVRAIGSNLYLVAGQENHSQLYNVQTRVQDTESSKLEGSTTRKRRTSETNGCITGEGGKAMTKRLAFKISPSDSVQTDFNKEEPLQKVVRISWDGKLMVTGGTDGHIRLWKFPLIKQLHDITGHSNEIDDIDFNCNGSLIVTVSKDGTSKIWDTNTGHEQGQLIWPCPSTTKYLFKRCRFGRVEENPNENRLFLVTNPVGKAGKSQAFLQLWEPMSRTLKKIAGCDESIAALAVRDDGRFVATGTMFSGSVMVYVAFSLQRVMQVKSAHHMFVTGLEFLPVNNPLAVTSNAEAALISISVDNRVCIHTLRQRHSMPIWMAIILIVMTLFLTFLFCSYIGL